ncbi:hypothetical protein GGI07_001021 [Coemansia sp. Benny D115]|nr:hypothetical protein GGI07_001021 [Coemansia sp. Benny D115]
MPQEVADKQSKRQLDAETSAGPSKRARKTAAEHIETCDESDCEGCAAGPITLETDVLDLPAPSLLAMAEKEVEANADHAVICKLYEAALEKFADQETISHAWALLRFAEFIEYQEYADKAIAMAEKLEEELAGEDKARAVWVSGRARVLNVCADPENREDEDDYFVDEYFVEEEEAEAVLYFAGEKTLADGLERIAKAVELTAGEKESKLEYVLSTLEFYIERYRHHALCSKLRLKISESALDIAEKHVDWAAGELGPLEEMSLRVATWWALAACKQADDEDACELIEKRLAPVLKYLQAQTSSVLCCKLHAELLISISTIASDEDRVVEMFDTAIEALEQAHKLDPKDEGVIQQLSDLGIEIC